MFLFNIEFRDIRECNGRILLDLFRLKRPDAASSGAQDSLSRTFSAKLFGLSAAKQHWLLNQLEVLCLIRFRG